MVFKGFFDEVLYNNNNGFLAILVAFVKALFFVLIVARAKRAQIAWMMVGVKLSSWKESQHVNQSAFIACNELFLLHKWLRSAEKTHSI